MNGLTAADFADTGQWRLLIRIRKDGMSAHLENTIRKEIEPQLLFSKTWNSADERLLENIENTVYDNPRVLDDFATRIILYDPCTLFSPTELIEETEGSEENFHTTVYPCEPADVMSDTDSDITATYSMAPGVKSFLYRTFPGSRITSNLMDEVRHLRKDNLGLSLYVNIREGEADYIFLEDKNLLSASTHVWRDLADVIYQAFNLYEVYEKDPRSVSLSIKGIELPQQLREYVEANGKLI